MRNSRRPVEYIMVSKYPEWLTNINNRGANFLVIDWLSILAYWVKISIRQEHVNYDPLYVKLYTYTSVCTLHRDV